MNKTAFWRYLPLIKMSTRKSALSVMAIGALSILQGCAIRPYNTDEFLTLLDDSVVRMAVDWPERDDHAYSHAFYNVDAKYFHWSENSVQYRWIMVKAVMRRDKWGKVIRTARIPDGMPILKPGDWVDVYLPPFDSMNYDQLNAPIILRLVCKDDDRACKDASEKQLNGKNEVVSRGRPDMQNLTFSKKFDRQGELLK